MIGTTASPTHAAGTRPAAPPASWLCDGRTQTALTRRQRFHRLVDLIDGSDDDDDGAAGSREDACARLVRHIRQLHYDVCDEAFLARQAVIALGRGLQQTLQESGDNAWHELLSLSTPRDTPCDDYDACDGYSLVTSEDGSANVRGIGAPLKKGDKALRKAWTAWATTAQLLGLRRCLACGLDPPPDNGAAGLKWYESLRAAARACQTWECFLRRANRILLHRRSNEQQRRLPAPRPPTYAGSSCPFVQRDLVDLRNWYALNDTHGWPDVQPTSEELRAAQCILDDNGLVSWSFEQPGASTKRNASNAASHVTVNTSKRPKLNAKGQLQLLTPDPSPTKGRVTFAVDDSSTSEQDDNSTSSSQEVSVDSGDEEMVDAGSGTFDDDEFEAALRRELARLNSDEESDMDGHDEQSRRREGGEDAQNDDCDQEEEDQDQEPEQEGQDEQGQENDEEDGRGAGRRPPSRPSLPADADFDQQSLAFEVWRTQVVKCFEDLAVQDFQSAEHYDLAIHWLKAARPAVFGYHGGETWLGTHFNQDLDNGDAMEIRPADLLQLLDDGHVFSRPIVIRHEDSQFSDSSIDFARQHLRFMCDAFVEVECQQHSQTHPRPIRVEDFAAQIEPELSYRNSGEEYHVSQTPCNLLSLGRIGQSQTPGFLSHPRLDLLGLLTARATGGSGKKAVTSRTDDISKSHDFNLFATSLSFSAPHVDVLSGTWTRILSGVKAWLIADPTAQHRADFEHHSGKWRPAYGTVYCILLRKNDVLVMPPGIPVIHAPVTILPCLIHGGAFWDRREVLSTLDHVHWTAMNPAITNEPVPLHLRQMLDALKAVVLRDYTPFLDGLPDFPGRFAQAVSRLSDIGCHCTTHPCPRESCPCLLRGSRCTELCQAARQGRHKVTARMTCCAEPET